MIWELRCAKINSFAPLVLLDREDSRSGMLETKGAVQDWKHRPAVQFFAEPKKKAQPRANVIYLKPGALVLDAKAKLAAERMGLSPDDTHSLKASRMLIEWRQIVRLSPSTLRPEPPPMPDYET